MLVHAMLFMITSVLCVTTVAYASQGILEILFVNQPFNNYSMLQFLGPDGCAGCQWHECCELSSAEDRFRWTKISAQPSARA